MEVSMNKIISVILFLCITIFAEKGIVRYTPSGCDWFVVETNTGMVLLEWYGGNEPDVGDAIVGNLSGYGMRDLYNVNTEKEIKAWLDDYMMSKEDALEELYEECD